MGYVAKEVERSDEDHSEPYDLPLKGVRLKYDDGYIQKGKDGTFDHTDENSPWRYPSGSERINVTMWKKPGTIAQAAINMYGLPLAVRGEDGNPLGCTCHEAFLHGVGEMVDGIIEADYVCDYGYHNYVIFSLRSQEATPENTREVSYDKYGNLVEDVEKSTPHKLEEM